MSADPTAEHIHWTSDAPTSLHGNGAASFRHVTRDIREVTCRLCHSLYPEHARERDAALAASLPAEVKAASMTDAEMLAALVDRGTLTAEDAPIARYGGYEHTHWQQRWDGQHTHEGRRFVTPWEVAP